MSQSDPNLSAHPAIPMHHVAFGAAALVTVCAIVVWVMDATAPHPAAGGALPFLRIFAAVMWVWFFGERNRQEMLELREAVDDLHNEAEGLDPDSELALRRINRRLGGAR